MQNYFALLLFYIFFIFILQKYLGIYSINDFSVSFCFLHVSSPFFHSPLKFIFIIYYKHVYVNRLILYFQFEYDFNYILSKSLFRDSSFLEIFFKKNCPQWKNTWYWMNIIHFQNNFERILKKFITSLRHKFYPQQLLQCIFLSLE